MKSGSLFYMSQIAAVSVLPLSNDPGIDSLNIMIGAGIKGIGNVSPPVGDTLDSYHYLLNIGQSYDNK